MAATLKKGESKVADDQFVPMRPPIDLPWVDIRSQLSESFGYTDSEIADYEKLDSDKAGLLKTYESMQLARLFENACNQQYMGGKIRGFMHLDNGPESIPALVADSVKNDDK